MLKVFFCLGLLSFGSCLFSGSAAAQPGVSRSAAAQPKASSSVTAPPAAGAQTIPLTADNWIFQPGSVQFTEGPVMKIVSRSGAVVGKNIDFSEGTIDFDIQPTDPDFASFYFHWQDTTESESFYFRTTRGAGHPDIMEGVQYTPIVKGISLWDLLPHYQGNASFQRDSWNHVRILIAGRQMLIYVNSDRPTLAIPRLEGNTTHGTLAFDGQATIAHLVVRGAGDRAGAGMRADGISAAMPAAATWLAAPEGVDPTDNDPRYLRHWQVTEPQFIPKGVDFSYDLLPSPQAVFSPIRAERRGLLNLTRLYGGNLPRRYEDGPPRRIVWLKTTLQSVGEKICTLRLGFSDEVWIFLNGLYLYADKNNYGAPIMKRPRGRLSIENSQFELPLRQGSNELLIGLANSFYGWGITARLDDNEGIKIE